MAYAESVGLSSFLQNLSQNLMNAAARKQSEEDELRKLETERAARLIDAGRIMYQKQASLATPLTLSGQPTISGAMDLNGFLQNPMPGLGIPEPAPTAGALRQPPLSIPEQHKLAELRKPTLENVNFNQEAEILKAVRSGQPIPERYTTVEPELPGAEDLSKVEVDAAGNVKKTYDILGKRKAADLKAYKDNYIKYQKMAVGARANDSSFKALAMLQKEAYATVNDFTVPLARRTEAADDFERYTAELEQIAPAGAREPKPKPGPANPANPPASDGKVVVEKDGKRFNLPKSQLQDAIKQGYKQVI